LPCASPAWPILITTRASARSPLHPSCPKQLVQCWCTSLYSQLTITWSVDHQWSQWSHCAFVLRVQGSEASFKFQLVDPITNQPVTWQKKIMQNV
jgi:hypothetical protein